MAKGVEKPDKFQGQIAILIPTLALSPQQLSDQLRDISVDTAGMDRAIIVVQNRNSPVPLPDFGQMVVCPGLNLGYGGGLQFARKFYHSEFTWVVQDDMEIQPGALQNLLSELNSDQGLAAVSPVKIRPDGLVHPGGAGGTLDSEFRWDRAFPETATSISDYVYEDIQTHIPGGGMLIRTEILDRVGGFDPRFFPKQKVDVDLCLRLAANHSRFRVSPRAWIVQNHGQSVSDGVTRFLQEHHRKTLLHKHSSARPTKDVPVYSDSDLVLEVAKAATHLFLEYAKYSSTEIEGLSRELLALKPVTNRPGPRKTNLVDAFSSRSMRVIRSLGQFFGERNRL